MWATLAEDGRGTEKRVGGFCKRGRMRTGKGGAGGDHEFSEIAQGFLGFIITLFTDFITLIMIFLFFNFGWDPDTGGL